MTSTSYGYGLVRFLVDPIVTIFLTVKKKINIYKKYTDTILNVQSIQPCFFHMFWCIIDYLMNQHWFQAPYRIQLYYYIILCTGMYIHTAVFSVKLARPKYTGSRWMKADIVTHNLFSHTFDHAGNGNTLIF